MISKVWSASDKFSLLGKETFVGSFVGNLIRDGTKKDLSKIHDVGILRWDRVENHLFDEIVDNVRGENVLLMPRSSFSVVTQRIRAASFIVIISDVTSSVSR